jgi:hypothetical protein
MISYSNYLTNHRTDELTYAADSICSSEELQSYSRSYQTCMEPEGSFQCKQQPLAIAVISQINIIAISHIIDLRSI